MIRKVLTATAVAVSLTIAACGGTGVDEKKVEDIQDHAAEIQKDAQQTAKDVQNGTKDAEEAAKEINEDMNDLANETIDAAKDANIPGEAREQLEAAQDEMNAAAGGN